MNGFVDSEVKFGAARRIGSLALAATISVLGWTGSASAAPCMADAAGDPTLNCTANDLGVASVTVTNILDDGCVAIGDTFTFDGTLNVDPNATTRYDLGFYIGADSEQALTGTCSVNLIPPVGAEDIDFDSCGDKPKNASLGVPVSNVTVVCNDSNGDGFFDLAICASYDNNAGDNCAGVGDLIPGTSAKCQCSQVETNQHVPNCNDAVDPFICPDDGNPCTDTVCNPVGSGLGDINGCSNDPNTNLCRASTGECDVAENCTAGSCPADGFAPGGDPCTTDGNACTNDVCDGGGECVHNDNNEPCDDGLFCTQNDACSAGACTGTPVVCDDFIACTNDACNEATDSCVSTPDNSNCEDGDGCTTDICSIQAAGCIFNFTCSTDICRSPGFWATHSGYEKLPKSVNVGQLVLDAAGPLEVCGQSISTTSNLSSPFVDGLGLTSDLEGLCMRAKGVPQRQLFRQLTAAALNCAISGADCDAILSKYINVSFTACSDVCAGNPPAIDPPSVGDCVAQLDCFNNGGQMIDDVCVYDLPGNCHDTPLCNEALGVCPKSGPASSPNACKEARFDGCTIDSCN